MSDEFGPEAERPGDAQRDYPALIDGVVEEAGRLLELVEEPNGDEGLRAVLNGMVELGRKAQMALDHWQA